MFDFSALMGPTGTMTDADVLAMLRRIIEQLQEEVGTALAELEAEMEAGAEEVSDGIVQRQLLIGRLVGAAINF